jgi:hypothetical protein
VSIGILTNRVELEPYLKLDIIGHMKEQQTKPLSSAWDSDKFRTLKPAHKRMREEAGANPEDETGEMPPNILRLYQLLNGKENVPVAKILDSLYPGKPPDLQIVHFRNNKKRLNTIIIPGNRRVVNVGSRGRSAYEIVNMDEVDTSTKYVRVRETEAKPGPVREKPAPQVREKKPKTPKISRRAKQKEEAGVKPDDETRGMTAREARLYRLVEENPGISREEIINALIPEKDKRLQMYIFKRLITDSNRKLRGFNLRYRTERGKSTYVIIPRSEEAGASPDQETIETNPEQKFEEPPETVILGHSEVLYDDIPVVLKPAQVNLVADDPGQSQPHSPTESSKEVTLKEGFPEVFFQLEKKVITSLKTHGVLSPGQIFRVIEQELPLRELPAFIRFLSSKQMGNLELIPDGRDKGCIRWNQNEGNR